MENKRPLSPSACTFNQLAKRLRIADVPPERVQQCLHCRSTAHDWVHCSNLCKHCDAAHPRRRCSRLDISYYTPGGFRVIARSETDAKWPSAVPQFGTVTEPMKHMAAKAMTEDLGVNVKLLRKTDGVPTDVNSERVALINSASAFTNRPAAVPVHAVGPQRSGSNVLPLGQSRVSGASSHGASSDRAQQITLPSSTAPADHKRDRARERRIWTTLQQQIHDAVEDTATAGKPFNGVSARGHVKQRVNDACNILRQIILGGESEKEPHGMQLRESTVAARQVCGTTAEPMIKEESLL